MRAIDITGFFRYQYHAFFIQNFKLYRVLHPIKTDFPLSHEKYKKNVKNNFRHISLSCFRNDTLTIFKIKFWCSIPP